MIHYIQISKGEASLLIDRENNIILMSGPGTNWETNLRKLVHTVVDRCSLSPAYLILVKYVREEEAKTAGWRIAQLSFEQGQFLPPEWKQAHEDDINRLLWLINSSADAVKHPPFLAHVLVQLLKSGKAT